jgi:hypothetical protein
MRLETSTGNSGLEIESRGAVNLKGRHGRSLYFPYDGLQRVAPLYYSRMLL